jgi:VWFA-related protein
VTARLAALLAGIVAASAGLAAQQPRFRSSAATVIVDVSVTDDGKDVPNLTTRDFRLTDNGVPQAITTVARVALPIDVTFIADISGRTEGAVLDSFRRAIDDVLGRLGVDDRASLVLFDPRIRELDGLERSRLNISAEHRPSTGGPAALVDAVAVSLIRTDDPGRRRMAVVFSDGQDAGSFLDEGDLMDVAARSGVTIFVVAVTDGTSRTPQRPANLALLSTLAEATGGMVAVVQRDEDVGPPFIAALQAFRTSYVLQYTPAQVEASGWHDLQVTVPRSGRYTVRARKGYFADGTPPRQ